MGSQTVICIDMKSYFASVECADRGYDPFKTMLAVADDANGNGGICLAITPAMKIMGVKNRCRLYELPRELNPIVVKPRIWRYEEMQREFSKVFAEFFCEDDIFPYSIDESFMNVGPYLKLYGSDARTLAKRVIDRLMSKLALPSSAGMGPNLYLAKIALDTTAKKSPDSIGWLDEELFSTLLSDHRPITDFWGISFGTQRRLEKLGIFDMAGIKVAKEETIVKEFGPVVASVLINHAWGRENATIADLKKQQPKTKTMSSTHVLPHPLLPYKARLILLKMARELTVTMAEKGYKADKVRVLVSENNSHVMIGDWIKLEKQTSSAEVITRECDKLFGALTKSDVELRRVGVVLEGLENTSSWVQLKFFEGLEQQDREEALMKALVDIRERYGEGTLFKASDALINTPLKQSQKIRIKP